MELSQINLIDSAILLTTLFLVIALYLQSRKFRKLESQFQEQSTMTYRPSRERYPWGFRSSPR